MLGADDMIINWWNLLKINKSKIWEGAPTDFRQDAYSKVILRPEWIWWHKSIGIPACQEYHQELVRLAHLQATGLSQIIDANFALQTYIQNGNGKARCGKGWSDFFYIPHRISRQYRVLDNIAYERRLFLEMAVTNILRSLDLAENVVNINGVYLPELGLAPTSDSAWRTYNRNISFIHPFKFGRADFDFDKFKAIVLEEKKYQCRYRYIVTFHFRCHVSMPYWFRFLTRISEYK